MDDARNLCLVLALHGETVASVSHGDDTVHQTAAVLIQRGIQLCVHALIHRAELPPDATQLRRSIIRDHVLRENAAVQFSGLLAQRLQRAEICLDGIGFLLGIIVNAVAANPCDAPKERADVQELCDGQGGADCKAHEGGTDLPRFTKAHGPLHAYPRAGIAGLTLCGGDLCYVC